MGLEDDYDVEAVAEPLCRLELDPPLPDPERPLRTVYGDYGIYGSLDRFLMEERYNANVVAKWMCQGLSSRLFAVRIGQESMNSGVSWNTHRGAPDRSSRTVWASFSLRGRTGPLPCYS